jgi:hypothetical protein
LGGSTMLLKRLNFSFSAWIMREAELIRGLF